MICEAWKQRANTILAHSHFGIFNLLLAPCFCFFSFNFTRLLLVAGHAADE